MKYIFGPVPSRRLGLSLGVDLVPAKTCNLDCLYCECGPTTDRPMEPDRLISAEAILDELKRVLDDEDRRIDCITLSGAGEPTLNSEMGRVLTGIKELNDARLTLLTNATLLDRPDVIRAIQPVDIILPSLDSAIESTFRRINRPHPDIKLDNVLKGLENLKDSVKAEIWLEILFLAGINDTDQEIEALVSAVERIRPDKVQINSLHRPPAYSRARAVDMDSLKDIAKRFGPTAEVIAKPPTKFRPSGERDVSAHILEMIDRRPCTIKDIEVAVGRDVKELDSLLIQLVESGRVRKELVGGQEFLRGILTGD